MVRLRAFVRLSRPLFLYGSVAGVALGAALAHRAGFPVGVRTYAWAQLTVSSFHLMVHYANDYFDRAGDRCTSRTAWSGGSGVLSAGELPPRTALIAAFACIAGGLAGCVHFALSGNPLVALLGLAILAGSWTYSAPPLRLAARGLGELDAALVVALLCPAAGYVAFARQLDAAALTALVPAVLAMLVMMLSVEIPDAGADMLCGKRTLVVRWGPSGAYVALFATTVAALVSLLAFGPRPAPGALALVPAALWGASLLLRVRGGDRRPATIAFLGVGYYALTATGLAAAYALGG